MQLEEEDATASLLVKRARVEAAGVTTATPAPTGPHDGGDEDEEDEEEAAAAAAEARAAEELSKQS